MCLVLVTAKIATNNSKKEFSPNIFDAVKNYLFWQYAISLHQILNKYIGYGIVYGCMLTILQNF